MKEELASFTASVSAIDSDSSLPSGTPVILPLLKKLYLPTATTAGDGDTKKMDIIPERCRIIQEKVKKYLDENSEHSPEHFLKTLAFTERDIKDVDDGSVMSGTHTSWDFYLHPDAKIYMANNT